MTITRWEHDGMPVAVKARRGKPTLFDPKVCDLWKAAHEAKKETDAGALSLSEERAKLAERQREKLELDMAVRRGQLIERVEVMRAGQVYTKAWASKVRALPKQLAQLGAVTTPEAEAIVELRCRQILEEIARFDVLPEVDKAS